MPERRLGVVVECGLLLAAALALAQLKLFALPSGGSVSLGCFPILLLAARRGPWWGAMSGFMMGWLSFAIRPFALGAVQLLLDYPLAGACLGLTGFIPWCTPARAIGSTVVANVARLGCHVLAGFSFIHASASGQSALLASLTYNLMHMVPETVICAAVAGYLSARQSELVLPRIPTGPAGHVHEVMEKGRN